MTKIAVHFQNERLKRFSRLKETINAMCDSELDSGSGKKNVRILLKQLLKTEYEL